MGLPAGGEDDVRDVVGGCEEGGDLFVGESGDATADTGDEEGEFRVRLGELDELVDIGADGLYPTLHRGDAVALALQADALAHDGPKLAVGGIGSTTAMHAFQVAAEDEDLVRLELCDTLRCCTFLFHNLINCVLIRFGSEITKYFRNDKGIGRKWWQIKPNGPICVYNYKL